jgi:dUTP pyrophosphatase
MEIKVKRLRQNAKLPTRAYERALAYDFYFAPQDLASVVLQPHNTCKAIYNIPSKLSTGIAMQLPDGYGLILRERGSTGIKGLSIRAGVIDEDFRGEVFVLMQNLGDFSVTINPGDKIAQGILIPTPTAQVIEVSQLNETQRGEKVLGSSD